MLNDRDDKHDDHEESEYHFSDEDISYEAEPESPKSVNASGSNESIGSRLSRSKRMIISASVFFVLVFIVYKVVTPTSTGVPADLNTPMIAASTQSPPKAKAPAEAPAASAPVQQPVQPVVSQVPTEAMPQQSPVVQVQVQAPAPTPTSAPAAPTTEPASAAAPVAATSAPAQAMAAPATAPAPAVNQVAVNQSVSSQPAAAATPPAVVAMPAVIPVAVAPTAQAVPAQAPMPPPAPETMPSGMGGAQPPMGSSPTVTIVQSPEGSVDARIASLEANNQKLMNQMQSDYSQKVSDYTAQNKALQDQIQTLNSRVSGMETQLNQLVNAITRQGQGQTQMTSPQGAPGAPLNKQLPPLAQEIKVAFSVQAIIPGRAWLRSDNGEALTVAEGDAIKGLGRVTKIDPYDGVVEVNTGNRIISLSYGNGAES